MKDVTLVFMRDLQQQVRLTFYVKIWWVGVLELLSCQLISQPMAPSVVLN